jgi:YHS domain-containing protein
MGFIRLLIFAGIVYFLYRAGRRILGSFGRIESQKQDGSVDEMIQDPQCGIYVPRRDAQQKVIRGEEFFFCSSECAQKFENLDN